MKARQGFVSIKTKFISISILISLLLTVSISYIWYTTTLKNAKKGAIDYMAALIQQSNQHLDSTMKDMGTIVNLLAFDETILETLEKEKPEEPLELVNDQYRVGDILYRICSFRSNVRGIKVMSLDGRFYEFGTTMLYEDIMNAYWVKNLLTDKEKQIIAPHYFQNYHTKSLSDGNKVITIARPIFSSVDKRRLGFVLVDMEAGLLQKTYNMDLKDDASVYIKDSTTNQLLYGSNDNGISVDEEFIEQLDISGEEGIIEKEIDGQSFVLVYETTKYAKWTTIGIISEDILLKDYYDAREIVLIVSGAITLIAVVLISLMANILTKQIRTLNDAMQTISKDNLDCHIDIGSKDEIGQLSHQFVYLVNRIKGLIKEIKRNEKDKKHAELSALKAQMNPHFLFNTLNTIKFLGMMQKADNIVSVSESLATLMHINMDSRHFITLEEEFKYIESYMAIQKYKFTHDVTYSIQKDVDAVSYYIPKLMLQPLVENALKHGFSEIDHQGHIDILVIVEQDMLHISIKDNGKGISDVTASTSGIGLNNIKQRLGLYFEENANLKINSVVGQFTEVILRIPLITEEERARYE